MRPRAALTGTNAHPSARVTDTIRTAIAEYTAHPSSVHHHHGSFSEHQAYTRLKVAQARMPSRHPWAAREANCGPCSTARKNNTGAEVSGMPSNQPETAGPHLRPARLISAISTGAKKILNKST